MYDRFKEDTTKNKNKYGWDVGFDDALLTPFQTNQRNTNWTNKYLPLNKSWVGDKFT